MVEWLTRRVDGRCLAQLVGVELAFIMDIL